MSDDGRAELDGRSEVDEGECRREAGAEHDQCCDERGRTERPRRLSMTRHGWLSGTIAGAAGETSGAAATIAAAEAVITTTTATDVSQFIAVHALRETREAVTRWWGATGPRVRRWAGTEVMVLPPGCEQTSGSFLIVRPKVMTVL